jgi:hypothetical protein
MSGRDGNGAAEDVAVVGKGHCAVRNGCATGVTCSSLGAGDVEAGARARRNGLDETVGRDAWQGLVRAPPTRK